MEEFYICPCCGQEKTDIARRRLNTLYVEEESNFLTSCGDCYG